MLSRLPRGRCLSKYLMVSTRAQHGRLTTKPSHESFRDPPGGQVAVEQSDTAAIKQEIALASPKPHPEVLQKAAETLLGADRPGADAPKIKKKVKVNRLQPSVSATDLPHLQAKAERIYKILMDLFEDPPCPLDHKSSFQLLVSVILSAQVRASGSWQVCLYASSRPGGPPAAAVVVVVVKRVVSLIVRPSMVNKPQSTFYADYR